MCFWSLCVYVMCFVLVHACMHVLARSLPCIMRAYVHSFECVRYVFNVTLMPALMSIAHVLSLLMRNFIIM
jgi:hypothetical protein